jgi:Zinc finger, C3HC4 type (RING finger)
MIMSEREYFAAKAEFETAESDYNDMLRNLPHHKVDVRTILRAQTGVTFSVFKKERGDDWKSTPEYIRAHDEAKRQKLANKRWIADDEERQRVSKRHERARKVYRIQKQLFENRVFIDRFLEVDFGENAVKLRETNMEATFFIQDRQAVDEEDVCVCCTVNVACVANGPCAHKVMCGGCTTRIKSGVEGRRCPVCRAELKDFKVIV